ncbi:MAG TPA: M20/M25/M40 family metallo-hydrolase [Candidatus Methanoculleus thermohydrogenotrophicum]|jgi:succinyl-diaminopimelate desuccinylase|nr:M20 family metallopeptidase [Candidatus Methanoculleus thermohydrogenotrophicum]HOB18994.1 M20/M25/M40 family metallo-hydrolase [Candidatus Methanoculleus thermohydrogenotrophicum]HPZ39032.1 M20/M25/M40 family metallo-hydrolase [Candidatus Methanoculleus thermohydrogenotrophicum]HQC92157.1 M20/M25/M40 family metallo-hydrolase [Candidatus Methanoculleus thermohydrogenotrophicum]
MDVARLTSSLVRLRSENPPGKTTDVVEYIREFLDSLGLKCRIVSHPGGRDNLITTKPDPGILLCGHVDVVPAIPDDWTHDPYGGEIADGYVWGRGATDMKGGCAALLIACRDLIESGVEPKVQLAFVCDEETGGEHGIRSLLAENLLLPRDCLIAEPTPPTSPAAGQKGLYRIDLSFRGEPGHSSLYPMVGKSAIMAAFDLIGYLREVHVHPFPVSEDLQSLIAQSARIFHEIFGLEGVDDVLTRVMFNPGRIEGGEKANIVAEQCRMELDIRVPWGCPLDDLRKNIAEHAPDATIHEMDVAEPTLTPVDARVVRTVCREVERVYGRPAVPLLQWAASDAKYLRTEGFDVVEYGPGEIPTLHAVDERVSVEQLEKAVDVYRGVIQAYSG